jgi:hypothetical protein
MRWAVNTTPHPTRFMPGRENLYPLYRSLGGPQGQSGRVWKITLSPGFNPRTVQPVANRYTAYAIPAHLASRFRFPNLSFFFRFSTSVIYKFINPHSQPISHHSRFYNPSRFRTRLKSRSYGTSFLHFSSYSNITAFSSPLVFANNIDLSFVYNYRQSFTPMCT